jgi:hypothetical protein
MGQNIEEERGAALELRVKLRIFNDPRSFHPRQHPIHRHGQRMLVASRDGVPTRSGMMAVMHVIP